MTNTTAPVLEQTDDASTTSQVATVTTQTPRRQQQQQLPHAAQVRQSQGDGDSHHYWGFSALND